MLFGRTELTLPLDWPLNLKSVSPMTCLQPPVGYTASVFLLHGEGQTKVLNKKIEYGVGHTRGNHCLPSLICSIVGSPQIYF